MYTNSNKLLIEAIWTPNQDIIWIQRMVLIAVGIAFLIIAAKIKLILPFSPVPVTLGTFAVLTIGTTYGQRLGCLLYTSPSPRDVEESRMPSSA